ncbi:PREDICTED: transmembrane 4 L6 family member 19 isoform X2 [Chinchilla lanigera]|uniref:transmembrane 4 L6 family member 19 isoform X2 n=1 Tax=Chinchilla lanigera TaxID=34839 RepID=UPI0006985025|nr:PREDICTED: transmembrane 4 L6 family member 19 isoform X2 [Chinchilla lanigera]
MYLLEEIMENSVILQPLLRDCSPASAPAAAGMLFSPRLLGCSRTCSRVLGLSLGAAALFAAGANAALLFPSWDVTYLLRGLVGRHALLGSGLWGGGLMILTALLASGLALLGALTCFITSGVALRDGPLCMFDVSSFNQTQAWKYGYPFKDLRHTNYLYDRSLWNSVCLEPSKAVVWHVSFFSVLLCTSALQLLLVAVHSVNSLLGLFCSLCEE